MNCTGCGCSAARSCNSLHPSLHLTGESTQRHGRDAAGCSPKTASAVGKGPWRTVYSRARGTGAAAGRAGAERRSNLCVVACCCAHGARRYVARSMHHGSGVACRCKTRLSLPGVIAHVVAARNATIAAALLLDRAIPSIPSLHLTGESTLYLRECKRVLDSALILHEYGPI